MFPQFGASGLRRAVEVPCSRAAATQNACGAPRLFIELVEDTEHLAPAARFLTRRFNMGAPVPHFRLVIFGEGNRN